MRNYFRIFGSIVFALASSAECAPPTGTHFRNAYIDMTLPSGFECRLLDRYWFCKGPKDPQLEIRFTAFANGRNDELLDQNNPIYRPFLISDGQLAIHGRLWRRSVEMTGSPSGRTWHFSRITPAIKVEVDMVAPSQAQHLIFQVAATMTINE